MSKTILTVDDAPTMRKMIGLTLKTAGYQVVEAPDGPEALELLSKTPVDMMIFDVNMPKMNGVDLLRKVRASGKHARTPILMLTTESNESIKAQARAAGATGWIVKPFKQDQLLAVARKVFGG